MDNDVMFGKPHSYFSQLHEGIYHYDRGGVTPDLYALTQQPKIFNGHIHLQIKEIEPEKSAIDFARLKACIHEKNTTIVTKSDFSGYIQIPQAFLTTTLNEEREVSIHRTNTADSQKIKRAITRDEDLALEGGDSVEFVFRGVKNNDSYLILDSWYRDWTLGEIFWKNKETEGIISPVSFDERWSLGTVLRSTTAGAMAAIIGFFGFGNSPTKENNTMNDDGETISSLLSSFGIEKAFADNPHKSLVVSVLKGKQYQKIEVVQPRYRRPTVTATKIPQEAMEADGTVRLRVQATKRHRISGIGIFSVEDGVQTGVEEHSLELTSVTPTGSDKEFKAQMSHQGDGSLLRTQAGDSYDLVYKVPQEVERAGAATQTQTTYLLEIGGVYAYLPKEEQEALGNWTKKLDEEAIEFLETAYELNTTR